MAAANEASRVRAYSLLNGSISYSLEDIGVEFTLWGRPAHLRRHRSLSLVSVRSNLATNMGGRACFPAGLFAACQQYMCAKHDAIVRG